MLNYIVIINYLEYVTLIILGYIISIIIKYILDRRWLRFRIDNWILFALLVKSPLATSKVTLSSDKRPDITEIRNKIAKSFELDANEKPSNNSYIFRVSRHPTSMKIRVIEPDNSNRFILTLETISADQMPKINHGSFFHKTIEIFEEVTRLLENYDLKSIKVEITISSIIPDKKTDLATYNYKNNTIASNNITFVSNTFTGIAPLVRECINFWMNHFL